MTNTALSLNLLSLDQVAALNPNLAAFLERQFADTYEKFVNILYKDLDTSIAALEENPELRQEDGEDHLTVEIKNQLVAMGYNATHDEKHGGHTDLLVKKNRFRWIGEAKKHKDYDYLWEGFQQLDTRYSSGDDKQAQGGVIIYILNENAKAVMDNWKEHLKSKNLPDYKSEACQIRTLAFESSHRHPKSGLSFKVRHMPVLLHFKPTDKSGRARKKK
jgi:hypothetical protein